MINPQGSWPLFQGIQPKKCLIYRFLLSLWIDSVAKWKRGFVSYKKRQKFRNHRQTKNLIKHQESHTPISPYLWRIFFVYGYLFLTVNSFHSGKTCFFVPLVLYLGNREPVCRINRILRPLNYLKKKNRWKDFIFELVLSPQGHTNLHQLY